MTRGGAGADHRRGVSPGQCAPPHGPAVGGAHHPGGDVVLVGDPCWGGFPNGWWHPVSGGLEGDGHGKNSLGASGDLTVVGVEEERFLSLPHAHLLCLPGDTLGGLQVRDLSLELLFPLGQLFVL